MKILFLVRSLHMGGAERQLVYLANELVKREHDVEIITMYSADSFEGYELSPKIPLMSLNKKGRWDLFGPFSHLVKRVKEERPHAIHGYGVVPNLMVTCLKLFQRNTPCVWGIRSAHLVLSDYDWSARFVGCLEVPSSYFIDLIIFNSRSGVEHAKKRGLNINKCTVIENGIDTDVFCPDQLGRKRVRNYLHLSDDLVLVGFVGRADPVKDLATFVKAACLAISRAAVPVKAVIVGCGDASGVDLVRQLIKDEGMDDYFFWQPETHQIADWFNAMDIFVSSSYGEGFPNVICEAMACAVPAVVTDVGDSARIVGHYGVTVPARNAQAIANGIEKCVRLEPSERRALGESARKSIIKRFSISRLGQETERVLKQICGEVNGAEEK